MKKCLVVDDVEVTRCASEEFAKALGVSVVSVIDGEAAMQSLPHGGFDVVLLDWHLRKDSGLDLISQMRAIAPRIKIVVFSGVEGEDKRGEALRAGADAFLEKPTTKAKIEKTFKEVGIL